MLTLWKTEVEAHNCRKERLRKDNSKQRMRIAIGLNEFNEKENLEITLPQLKDFDLVIVVDGKYPHFDYPSDFSDDGGRELLEKYDNTTLIPLAANQIIKRNTYLNYAKIKEYDFLLVLDADMSVKVDWEEFREQLKSLEKDDYLAYNVEFHVCEQQWPFALLYKPARVEYYEIHHVLRCRKCHFEIDVTKQHTDNVKGISITHRNSHRSKEWELAKRDYQNWKLDWENDLRRERG